MSRFYRLFIYFRDAVFRLLPFGALQRLSNEFLSAKLKSEELMRQHDARISSGIHPQLNSFDGKTLKKHVLEKEAPWSFMPILETSIPGMLSIAEQQYYSYITKYYSGNGEVVELGPWLGLSTSVIIQGLIQNPNFGGKELHVYDDFTWRSSWMDKWLIKTNLKKPNNHDSFEFFFNEFVSEWKDQMNVRRRKISDYDGNESLQKIDWENGPIELIIVDCGRPLEVNEAWYDVFSPFFIKDRTLIIMQDWQNYKAIPEQHWENTKLFTDRKEKSIELIHEVAGGGIATFVYRG